MASRDPLHPNVLLVVADDLGSWALGCSGNSEIHTPVLDGLARRGTRFDNFFCTSPVCSPARASLLTGSMPSQHGVHDWISAGHAGTDGVDFLHGQTTLPEILADDGYRCGYVGKWHLGASDQPRPEFRHWFVHERGGSPYFDAPMFRDGQPERPSGYLSDVLADDALSFLDDASTDDDPFFLTLSFTAPHYPWVDAHPQDLLATYDDCSFDSCPQQSPHPWSLTQTWETAAAMRDPSGNLQGYFAAVTGLDRAAGRVFADVRDRGLEPSTLVVFVSDNGFNCGHHGIWGKGNGTYPQNMYDTSVKVPAIFSQPGRVVPDRVSETLASGYDLLPTLLDFLGSSARIDPRLPGRSLRRVLERGDDDQSADHVVVYDEYGPVRMIRTAEWKYVHRHPDGPHELYDLTGDPQESTNVVDQSSQRQRVAELRDRLDTWFAQYATAAHDGVRQPVTGLGQRARLGMGPPTAIFEPLPPEGSTLPDPNTESSHSPRTE